MLTAARIQELRGSGAVDKEVDVAINALFGNPGSLRQRNWRVALLVSAIILFYFNVLFTGLLLCFALFSAYVCKHIVDTLSPGAPATVEVDVNKFRAALDADMRSRAARESTEEDE
jgi:hypothetical protein